MYDLHENDTVKVIDPRAACFGETGTVRKIEDDGKIDVLFPHRGNGPVHFDRQQLEKATQEG